MGLGKTVQISSYLTSLRLSGYIRTALIVAPTTLLDWWESELPKWGPSNRKINVIKIQGGPVERKRLLCMFSRTNHCLNGHEMELRNTDEFNSTKNLKCDGEWCEDDDELDGEFYRCT